MREDINDQDMYNELKSYRFTLLKKSIIQLGMAMGRVFSGTCPAPPLMRRDLILINRFKTGLIIFFKTQDEFGYCPITPRL